ncbi:MarR family winged helix-turn-helix transcriptional regulator [Desulfobaculum bizertense]|uniref:MarR family winged helix-turn-helix transcriptional regulator n=1 Tax=Desulfobaculum bizertense TaxID=376490 RepID=UPI001F236F6E|nr:MarR family winged helix-turn-helix transcriptional regulator [Desulfobaculum bizertense]UIJ37520.1 MarR family winged helix-turn-helix transcriptional regulator [Desulfobaculum bizertense]
MQKKIKKCSGCRPSRRDILEKRDQWHKDIHRGITPGYRLAWLARLDALYLQKLMSEFDLGPGMIPYVNELYRREGQTQEELARCLDVNSSAAARSLAALEQRGLVERRVNPKNRRQKLVYPTEKNFAMREKFFAALEMNNEMLLRGFEPEEREQLMSFMSRMLQNAIGALEED